MATLEELTAILSLTAPEDSVLFNKVVAAVLKEAEVIRVEAVGTANHVNRLVWARQAFHDPREKTAEMFGALLAANAAATQTAIRGATDAAIQTAVAAAVNIFATGA